MDKKDETTISESATSLKYEKTQNRDIINTIERINRSQAYKPDVENVISEFSDTLHDYAKKIFKEEWRNNHESHENPKNLTVEVFVGSPVFKKENEGNFYSMSLSTVFYIDGIVNDGESVAEAESRM